MFTSIYKPKKIEDFIGNQHIIQPFTLWLLEWDTNNTNNNNSNSNKCALVSGLCGIGKSLLVELILNKYDYNIINIATDDYKDKTYMKNIIKNKYSYDNKKNVLVFSDIDGDCDYGFISLLTECIKETKIPIICICDNRYNQSIKPILNYCFDIKLIKPCYQDVCKLIYKVVINEKIKIKEVEIKELYEQSNGDIRFILNTLQYGLWKCNKHIQSTNIFETTSALLSMDETIENKCQIFWLSNDLHVLMIQENYINNILYSRNELNKLTNLDYSANALSVSDIFEKSVNKTKWELAPYIGLTAIDATSKCNKKTIIKFPQFLSKTSTIHKNIREKLDYHNIKFFKELIETKSKIKKVKASSETKSKTKSEIKSKTKSETKEKPIKVKK